MRRQRNDLCGRFMRLKCPLPAFCVELDALAKRFQDNCYFASFLNYRKYLNPRCASQI